MNWRCSLPIAIFHSESECKLTRLKIRRERYMATLAAFNHLDPLAVRLPTSLTFGLMTSGRARRPAELLVPLCFRLSLVVNTERERPRTGL